MRPSFHEQNPGLLADLDDPHVIESILDRVAGRTGWFDQGRDWSRVWARVVDAGTGSVQLAVESYQPTHELIVIDRRPDANYADPLIGTIDVHRFPDDAVLTTLPRVLRHHPTAEVIRYRSAKRCTFRVAGPTPIYVKVFGDARGRRLQREAEMLSDARVHGRIDFDVARPLGFDERTLAYSQGEVAGVPVVDGLAGPDGPALAHRLGQAAGSIPSSGMQPTETFGPSEELTRAVARMDSIAELVPNLAPRLAILRERLDAAHARLGDRHLLPIHGSPHANQWLIDQCTPALVDFDRFCMGDPELDVATFTGEFDFESDGDVDGVNSRFADGYAERHGPLDEARLGLYRAHKRLAKVYRTARSIRPDAHVRAARHLEKAMAALMQETVR